MYFSLGFPSECRIQNKGLYTTVLFSKLPQKTGVRDEKE
jgi:hypothetical protein